MSKPAAAPKGPEYGVLFPKDKDGKRSTSDPGKAVIAAAIGGANTSGSVEAAAKCLGERNWRGTYQKHLKKLVELSAASPEAALNAARAGVEKMHANFEYLAPGSTSEPVPFSAFMKSFKSDAKTALQSREISGTGAPGGKEIEVEYFGKVLKGEALKDQFNQWADYGTIEKDAAESLCAVASGKVDLKGKYYVMIGAGSAMGPLAKLLEHGATVVCVDVPGSMGPRPAAMWKGIIDRARKSPGRIIVPVRQTGSAIKENDDDASLIQAAGSNLIENPAEILEWLKGVAPANVSLTVGNYTYLDGDLHVKLALAADAIIQGLCAARKNTKVAFLCTPTDLHIVTDEAHKAASANYGWHLGRVVELVIQVLSLFTVLKKNALRPLKTDDASKTLKYVDGISTKQGQNYALAKRLQHWRAMIAYEGGHVVSSNIAPSTSTLSVVSNRTFQWAYGGMPYFKPYEIFREETTKGVMGAMLIYDTTFEESAANPKNRLKFHIDNTMELFKWNSVHGGVWRAAYTVDSIGEVSVLIHFLGGPKVFLPLVFFVFGALFLQLSGRFDLVAAAVQFFRQLTSKA
jgi:hypothetical protein